MVPIVDLFLRGRTNIGQGIESWWKPRREARVKYVGQFFLLQVASPVPLASRRSSYLWKPFRFATFAISKLAIFPATWSRRRTR